MSIKDIMQAITPEKESDLKINEKIEQNSVYQINDTVLLKDAKFYNDDGVNLNTADYRWKITNKEEALGQTVYECESKEGIVLADSNDIKGKIVPEVTKDTAEPEL